MKLDSKAAAAAALLGLLSAPSFASYQFFDDRVTFSGFGSVGAAQTNSDAGEFKRDDQASGADKDVKFNVDSNLGLQLTGKATDWLSATVQSLTMQGTDGKFHTGLEWAYVKLQPTQSLSAFAGRVTLPMFLISDSRNVGYANTWLRPPNEVYGMAMLHRLEGGTVSYALPIKGTTLTATGLYGKSSLHNFASTLDVDHVKGGNLTWESDGLTLRAGRVQGLVVVPNDIYVFSGIGASYDRGNVLVQGEFVTRRSKRGYGSLVDADGWYTLAGYRINKFVPYVSYADTKPNGGDASPLHLTEKQSTLAAGVRWDAFSSSAIKLQVEHIDTHDTSGISFSTPTVGVFAGVLPIPAPITKPVTAVSLAMDVVF